jgi:hypothetical protein
MNNHELGYTRISNIRHKVLSVLTISKFIEYIDSFN